MARILVTGAGGFIGRPLCAALVEQQHMVVAALRRIAPPSQRAVSGFEERVLGNLAPGDAWCDALRGIDAVIHLAQRAHRPPTEAALSREPQLAAALAEDAAQAGVRRFVYISSIKAMGGRTAPGRPFLPEDRPRPEDGYGRAKLASEAALAAVAARTGLELVIIRPPLVYGPGVGANFRALIRLAATGLPLPFAAIDNRRSLIFRDHLVDLIALAAIHPRAAGHILLACDGSDFSTPALIRALALAQGRTPRLFPFPNALFTALCRLPHIGPAVSRLTTSLEIADDTLLTELGWKPRLSPHEAIELTVTSARGSAPASRPAPGRSG